jgi:hypothetical protein
MGFRRPRPIYLSTQDYFPSDRQRGHKSPLFWDRHGLKDPELAVTLPPASLGTIGFVLRMD